MSAPVALAIVSYDSAADLPDCLAAISRLEPAAAEVVVVDCASRDDSVEVAGRHLATIASARILALESNLGFAGGTNRAIDATVSPWIVTLNPDARPAPDFLARLLDRAHDPRLPRVGAVAARLVRPGSPARLDACGMRLTRAWRHLDRGSGELDQGQYGVAERLFGATGAATLWRREALDDVALDGDRFDARFHSFREDAELCFRLQERCWDVAYEPTARAEHRRRVLPDRRRQLPAEINRRSLVNRYRLRIAHQRLGNLASTLPWTAARDLLALAWVVAVERSSLAAYGELWRDRRALIERRRRIAARRTAPAGAVERWFWRSSEPL